MSSGHIFISYPHTETEFTARLAADLRNSGVQVWMDVLEGGIRSGDDWRRAIEEGLDTAAAIIPIICPDYVSSKYCRNELARADDTLNLDIFPVLLRKIDKKPIEIQRHQYMDFTEWRDEPVYQIQLKSLLNVLKRDSSEQMGDIPDAETQYLTSLIAELEARKGVLEYVDLAGQIDEPVRPKPHLSDEWGLEGSFAVLEPSSDLDPENSQERRQFPLNNIRKAMEKHPRFVLIGDPGAGKTTTLRRLALDAARNRLTNPKTAPLPVLLYLPTWGNDASHQEFVPYALNRLGIQKLASDVVLFLDGLNEMGGTGAEKAKKLRDWLASSHAPARVIVTCRAGDYAGDLDLKLPTVLTSAMDEGRVRQFAQNYLGEDSEKFLMHLLPNKNLREREDEEPRNLFRLATNPYLLTALMVVFKSSSAGDLPRNNGALFRRLAMALWERERTRQTKGWIPFEQMEKVYGQLALAMVRENRPIDVSYEYVLYYLGSDSLLNVGSSATILQTDNLSVRFCHQLMQEYFAAAELRHHNFYERLRKPRFQVVRKNHVIRQSTKWDQIIIALCGIDNPNKIIQELETIDVYLAAQCIASGVDISEDTGRIITKQLFNLMFSERQNVRLATASTFIELNEVLLTYLTLDHDSSVIARLRDNLNDSNFRVRIASAIIAGRLRNSSVVPQLINLLRDSSRRVRGAAAQALGAIGSPDAVSGLIKKLSDEGELINRSIRVCDLAAESLERIGTPEALEAVHKWREEQDNND